MNTEQKAVVLTLVDNNGEIDQLWLCEFATMVLFQYYAGGFSDEGDDTVKILVSSLAEAAEIAKDAIVRQIESRDNIVSFGLTLQSPDKPLNWE